MACRDPNADDSRGDVPAAGGAAPRPAPAPRSCAAAGAGRPVPPRFAPRRLSPHGDRRHRADRRRPAGAGPRPAAGAVAGDLDGPPRQPRADDPLGREGRRPPDVERLDGEPDDRPLVRAPRGARPRVGQAARLAGPARDQLPARQARSPLPDDASRVRGPAVLSEPDQGSRPGRLLDRLRRHRRDGADLGRARASLRRRALRGAARRAPDRAARRRGARRGCLLGGDRGPDGEQARRGDVGRRPQPAVARPRRAGHRRRPAGRDVRGRGLALRDGQVRTEARRAGAAAPAHRRDAQRGVPAAAARGRARAARAPRGRRLRPRGPASSWRRSATWAATTSAR